MNKQTICRRVVVSMLSITAASWAQNSVGLGLKHFKDNCDSCYGASVKDVGLKHSFLLKTSSNLTRMDLHHGGKFPQKPMWEVINGPWSDDSAPHVSREIPV